jgi:hypothetical protein
MGGCAGNIVCITWDLPQKGQIADSIGISRLQEAHGFAFEEVCAFDDNPNILSTEFDMILISPAGLFCFDKALNWINFCNKKKTH